MVGVKPKTWRCSVRMDEVLTKFILSTQSKDCRVQVLSPTGQVLMKVSNERALAIMAGPSEWCGIGKGRQKKPRIYKIQQLARPERLSMASVTTLGRPDVIEHHPRAREWHRDVTADKTRLVEQGGTP